VKPLLFITGAVPVYRTGAFERLHEQEDIEVALFGGRHRHGGPASEGTPRFPQRHVTPAQLWRLAASGRHRAAVCSTGGRLALLAGWSGARRGGLPVIAWASLWAHPRTPAHALSYLPLRHLYRSADAVVTYGRHVSDYVRSKGARNVFEAPQSVDNDFWRAAVAGPPAIPDWPGEAKVRFVFVGRPAREKGLGVLLDAWRSSAPAPAERALLLAGDATGYGHEGEGVVSVGVLSPERLREAYAASDVLVVPSIATDDFREPWGLVVNEAMNRGLPVIASDAVGAVAGGLVRDGENGLVVPAGDAAALAEAIGRLAADAGSRARLGAAGAEDVLAYSHEAWAEGFSRALASVGLSRARW
jgi:glycosyltransferase involved in cell wall biosynthesis